MNIFGFSGILILAIVLGFVKSEPQLSVPVQNYFDLQEDSRMDATMRKIQQQLQKTEDTLNRGLNAENNPSLFYSTMPILKAIHSGSMTILKPDTNIDYKILNKQVIVIDPFSEEKINNVPFNLELNK